VFVVLGSSIAESIPLGSLTGLIAGELVSDEGLEALRPELFLAGDFLGADFFLGAAFLAAFFGAAFLAAFLGADFFAPFLALFLAPFLAAFLGAAFFAAFFLPAFLGAAFFAPRDDFLPADFFFGAAFLADFFFALAIITMSFCCW
jgi:hypothetical protein